MGYNRRINIVPTYRCNQRCTFCFYNKSLDSDRKVPDVLKDLEKARRLGMDSVDFLGGEVTLLTDLPGMIGVSKRLGFRDIGIISNGHRLAEPGYLDLLVRNGLSNIVLTILGHDEKTHDAVTKCRGSFRTIKEAVRLIKKKRLTFRTNTVIAPENYRVLPEISSVIRSYGPDVANFLFNMFCDDNRGRPMETVRYSDAVGFVRDAIDMGPAPEVNVRYVPFCLMKGYERHVCNMHQVHFDRHEWDYDAKDILKNGRLVNTFHQVAGFILEKDRSHYIRKGLADIRKRNIINYINWQNSVKHPGCSRCMFDSICEGLWKGYADIYGFEDIAPIKGERVLEPDQYRK